MCRRTVLRIAFLLLLCNSGRAQQVLDTVCPAAVGEVYRVKYNPGSTYWWNVDCGVVISPPGSDSIVVQWCSNPGLYTIKVVEFNRSGCPGDTMSARVFVRNGLNVFITGPAEICRGEILVLQAHGADKYIWNTGHEGPVLIVQADTQADFSVKGYDGNCKPDSASFKVKIWEKPFADFTFSSGKINQHEDVNFSFTGNNAKRLEWIFDNDTATSVIGGSDITYRFSDSGRHEVKLIAYNTQNCADTIIYKIMVGGSSTIFMPSAFTPDNNGLNDVLMPATYGIRSLEIIIYNRWGQRVTELHGLHTTWDGRGSDGKKVESGVYIYTLKAQGDDNQWHYLKGDITVLY